MFVQFSYVHITSDSTVYYNICIYSISYVLIWYMVSLMDYNHIEYVGVIMILMYNNNTHSSKSKELLLFDYISHQ